jgi:hypothetical protein
MPAVTSLVLLLLFPAATLAHSDTLAHPPTSSTYETDLAAFFNEVDTTYPFFDLKGIRDEWADTKTGLMAEAVACASDSAFLGIVMDAIGVLRDGHMRIRDANADIPPRPKRYYPGISFMPAINNRVVIRSAPKELTPLRTGVVVTQIDGQDAREFLEARAKEEWARGFNPSPQRARLFAYRIALTGEQGEKHTITYRDRDGVLERAIRVTSDREARGWPHTYNMPTGLKRVGRSFSYTRLADGAGYMYWRRIDKSIVPGIKEALAAHPNAKSWIVDLRGNGGGGYGRDLIEQINSMPQPVAVLIDAGCVSAGETVARDFVRGADAMLIGTRTGGASSSKRTWTFPSQIASVIIPTRSRRGVDGKPIEYNGIAPYVKIEVLPEEAARGINSAIRQAQDYLAAMVSKNADTAR